MIAEGATASSAARRRRLVDYSIDQRRRPPQDLGFLVVIFVAIIDALDALDRMPHDGRSKCPADSRRWSHLGFATFGWPRWEPWIST